MLRYILCSLFGGMAITASSYCAAQGMSTDKPDQTDGTSTTRPQQFQLETAIVFTSLGPDPAALVFSSLLRAGVSKNLEARIVTEQGLQRHAYLEETAQGFYPLAIGVKYQLLKSNSILPNIALLGHLQLPATNKTSEHHYWSPAFILAMDKKKGAFTFGINAGALMAAFEPQWSWQYSADLKCQLAKKWSMFVEYFSQTAVHHHADQNADAGILFQAGKYWIIFSSVGERLFVADHHFFSTAGIGVQF